MRLNQSQFVSLNYYMNILTDDMTLVVATSQLCSRQSHLATPKLSKCPELSSLLLKKKLSLTMKSCRFPSFSDLNELNFSLTLFSSFRWNGSVTSSPPSFGFPRNCSKMKESRFSAWQLHKLIVIWIVPNINKPRPSIYFLHSGEDLPVPVP